MYINDEILINQQINVGSYLWTQQQKMCIFFKNWKYSWFIHKELYKCRNFRYTNLKTSHFLEKGLFPQYKLFNFMLKYSEMVIREFVSFVRL